MCKCARHSQKWVHSAGEIRARNVTTIHQFVSTTCTTCLVSRKCHLKLNGVRMIRRHRHLIEMFQRRVLHFNYVILQYLDGITLG